MHRTAISAFAARPFFPFLPEARAAPTDAARSKGAPDPQRRHAQHASQNLNCETQPPMGTRNVPPPPPHLNHGLRLCFSARWQDGWAVKLPNPPPKTLGVSSGWVDPVPVAGGPGTGVSAGTGAGAQQAAAERGAITAGLVGTVTGMLVVVSLGLYFGLRKATHTAGGTFLYFVQISCFGAQRQNGIRRSKRSKANRVVCSSCPQSAAHGSALRGCTRAAHSTK